MSLRRVRKRDGREMPFEKSKIAAAVRSAQSAVGEDDPLFADEVADLVELALRRRYAWRGAKAARQGMAREASKVDGAEDAPTIFAAAEDEETTAVESVPGIEEIQDLVEVGLIELGRAAVAKAYILYRDRRSRARESMVSAASPDGTRENSNALLRNLRVREAQGMFPWSKGRIIAALVQEADLSRAQAEEVAGRVEARVIAAELKRISTALIRELVDNELVAMGLSGALLRQAPVSVPRHDLREALELGERSLLAQRAGLESSGRGRFDLRQVLGGDVLSRYAMTDVLEEASVERHLNGSLHVEDLTAPHLHLTQSLNSGLLLRGAPGAQAAFDALEEIAVLFGSVSRGVVLESPGALLQPLQKSQDGVSLRSWLLALAALARAAGRRVDLASFGPKSTTLIARLFEEFDDLAEFDDAKRLPRLFLDAAEMSAVLHGAPAALRARAERLLENGTLVPTWAPEGERYLGPAGRRNAREQGGLACGGAVSLNFVRVARQAGPWREDLLLEGLAHLVDEAIQALSELAKFQRDCRAARQGEARGRVAYALTPVGVREALRLVGDGELRADQGARLLGLCSEAARRFAAERGISVHFGAHHGGAAPTRFAEADAGGARTRQRLLFDGEESAPAPLRRYSRGFELGPLPGQISGRAQAQLLATIPAGSWRPLNLDRPLHSDRAVNSDRAGGACPQLDAFEHFIDERASLRRSVPRPLETAPAAQMLAHPILPLEGLPSEGPSFQAS